MSFLSVLKVDAKHPIKLFIYATVSTFLLFLYISLTHFAISTNQQEVLLVSEAEKIVNTNQKMANNILKKATAQVQNKNYSNTEIHKVVATYYNLFQHDDYGQNLLFWLSIKNKATIIDHSSVEHYAEGNKFFRERMNCIEKSYASNLIDAENYVNCNKITLADGDSGNLCTISKTSAILSKLIKNQSQSMLLLTYQVSDGKLKFSVDLKNPISSYLEFLYRYFFYFLLAWLSSSLVFLYFFKKIKNDLIDSEDDRKNLNSQLSYLSYLSKELGYRSELLFSPMPKSRYTPLTKEHINLVVNYFDAEIKKHEVKIRINVSENIKEIRGDVVLLQRLLTSILVEGFYLVIKNCEMEIIVDVEAEKIQLIYRDNNYACNFDNSADALKQNPFFIEKEILSDCVASVGGSIRISNTKYISKEIEILLPCVPLSKELTVVKTFNSKVNQ